MRRARLLLFLPTRLTSAAWKFDFFQEAGLLRTLIMPTPAASRIAAVVAAAGRSTRMGQPKQLLAWGDSTVLGAVVAHLTAAGADPVVCVVGHLAEEMHSTLRTTAARIVHNPDYAVGEMLSSYQAGLGALLHGAAAVEDRPIPWTGALLALGDQPHVPVTVIRQVIDQAVAQPDRIVIPSYAMRRGHPLYLPVHLWLDLLALAGGRSLRDLLRQHADAIVHVDVATDSVLRDIDTPDQYSAALAQTEPSDG